MEPICRISLLAIFCMALIGIKRPAFAQSTPDAFTKVDAYMDT